MTTQKSDNQDNVLLQELVSKINSEIDGLTLDQVTEAVKCVLDEVSNFLACGCKIELRGFGSFSLKSRQSQYARNPRTNQEIKMDGNHSTVYFRASRQILSALNDNEVEAETA